MVPSQFTNGFGGVRGEARTLDSHIKSVILFRLSYTNRVMRVHNRNDMVPQPFSLFSAVLVGEKRYDLLRREGRKF